MRAILTFTLIFFFLTVFAQFPNGNEVFWNTFKDRTPDSVTQYGGRTSNTGLLTIQAFTANQETAILIPAASNNVWWINLDETSFTYNLRRIGTTRLFSVKYELTKLVENLSPPWG